MSRAAASIVWHRQISVHAASSMALGFDDDLRLWDQLGVDQVGLMWSKLDARALASLARTIGRAGLRVSSIGVGPPLRLDAPESWPATVAQLRQATELAAEISAGCVYLATGSAPRLTFEEALARLESALAPVLGSAAEAGVVVALEPSGSERADLGFVRTVGALAAIPADAALASSAVVADLAVCWSEPDVVATMLGLGDRLVAVQLADRPLRRDEAAPRVVPGRGELPLGPLLAALVDGGFRRPFEIELVGAERDLDGYREELTAALRWVHAALGPELVVDPGSGRLRRR